MFERDLGCVVIGWVRLVLQFGFIEQGVALRCVVCCACCCGGCYCCDWVFGVFGFWLLACCELAVGVEARVGVVDWCVVRVLFVVCGCEYVVGLYLRLVWWW